MPCHTFTWTNIFSSSFRSLSSVNFHTNTSQNAFYCVVCKISLILQKPQWSICFVFHNRMGKDNPLVPLQLNPQWNKKGKCDSPTIVDCCYNAVQYNNDWWIPAQMASNAENVSIWWRHHVSAYIIAGSEAKYQSKAESERASYEMTFVNVFDKIDRFITAPYCI